MGNNLISSMIWKGNIEDESELLLLMEVEYTGKYRIPSEL